MHSLPVLTPAATEHIKAINPVLRQITARRRLVARARREQPAIVAELVRCGWPLNAAQEIAEMHIQTGEPT